MLTCTGDLSRNRTVGVRLGKGEKLADISATMKVCGGRECVWGGGQAVGSGGAGAGEWRV